MRKLGSKKRFVLIASTTAAVLVGSGVAFAYWSTTGSGTSTAVSAGTSSTLTVTQTGTITGLYPGGPAQNINLNIANSNASAQYLNTVAITVTGTTVGGTANPGCTSSDFTVVPATIGAEVPAGATNAYLGSSTGAKISMVDKVTNQDACKTAVVSLSFAAS